MSPSLPPDRATGLSPPLPLTAMTGVRFILGRRKVARTRECEHEGTRGESSHDTKRKGARACRGRGGRRRRRGGAVEMRSLKPQLHSRIRRKKLSSEL